MSLRPPDKVRKLQETLHAKAKGSPGYRFYTERWLGELAEQRAYRSVDRHTRRRLRQWLCAKHKVQGRGTSRFPDEYLYRELGLVRLDVRTHGLPWANA